MTDRAVAGFSLVQPVLLRVRKIETSTDVEPPSAILLHETQAQTLAVLR